MTFKRAVTTISSRRGDTEPCLHPVCDLFDPPSPIRTPIVTDAWIAERMQHIDASGIRKAFDMARSMKDPINLSIGLPDFDVADSVKAAAFEAIQAGKNQYTVTQGIPELRNRIQTAVDAQYHHPDRQVLITS